MKKNNININVDKDDFNLNDYLYTWNEFGQRPSKINLYHNINYDDFQEFFSNYDNIENCTFTEIYPTGEENLVNKKVFFKLNENLFVSYTQYDAGVEESILTEISLLYNKEGEELVNDIVESLNSISKEISDTEDKEKQHPTFSLNIGNSGLELTPTGFLEADIDNIELYFNDDTMRRVNKLSKSIKKSKKGLSIIHGERGTGKSTLIQYLVRKCNNKKFIFVPCSMFETTIINPEFRNFISKNPDSVIVMDDSEIYFSEMYSKSNIFTNNLLQLVDGLDSDTLNLQIITILNVSDIDQIDHILFHCNNLNDIIEVGKLEIDKIKELNKYLDKKVKVKKEAKLVDVLKKRNLPNMKDEIGF